MANYNPVVLAMVVATFAVAVVFIVLRMVARKVTRVHLWWDDYFAMAAFLFSMAWSAVVMQWTLSAGLGRPVRDIDMETDAVLEMSRLLLWNAEIFYAFSLAFSKLSILGFYWRLFKTSNIRLPIQILAGCSIVWLIIRTFMAIFHCVPVQAFWDHTIEDKACHINDSEFFFGTVLVHLVIDLCVLALPVVQVKHLRLRIGQKVAVVGLFMFGILVCVASVVVLVESVNFDPSSIEMPLNIGPIIIWATVEINFAIVSACLPMMRPIFRRMLPGSVLASDPSSKPISGPGGTGISGPGIKLATITRNKEMDETESTRQFVEDIESGSNHSNECEQPHGGGWQGPQTVISGRSLDDAPQTPRTESRTGLGRIHVKNEMSVSYERA